MDSRHHFIRCYSRQGRVAVLVEFGFENTQRNRLNSLNSHAASPYTSQL